jgi:hypothetical protein
VLEHQAQKLRFKAQKVAPRDAGAARVCAAPCESCDFFATQKRGEAGLVESLRGAIK